MRWSPPREALASTRTERDDWKTLGTLLPYLWAYKGRVLFALACLVAAKLATVGVPILLKDLVDRLSPATQSASGLLVVPVALVVAYGLLRLATSLFTELREFFFVNVTQAAMRTLALKTFRHLHALSLRYHLERRTGAVRRHRRREPRRLHRVHGARDQLADRRAATLERTGDARAVARGRLAAQLRATRTTRRAATTKRWPPASARP